MNKPNYTFNYEVLSIIYGKGLYSRLDQLYDCKNFTITRTISNNKNGFEINYKNIPLNIIVYNIIIGQKTLYKQLGEYYLKHSLSNIKLKDFSSWIASIQQLSFNRGQKELLNKMNNLFSKGPLK